jgi:hypothetical protein
MPLSNTLLSTRPETFTISARFLAFVTGSSYVRSPGLLRGLRRKNYLDILTLEAGINTLSQNVGNKERILCNYSGE